MPYLLAVSCVWGFSFPLIKSQLAGVDPLFVAVARLALSALCFIPFLRIGASMLQVIPSLCAVGAVQFGVMYAAYIAAFAYLPAHVIAFLTITTPIFVSMFSSMVKRRRLTLREITAVIIAVIGAGIIVYPQQAASGSLSGLLLILLSNICFAWGQVRYVTLKRASMFSDAQACAWLYLSATLTVIAIGCLCKRQHVFDVPALTQMQWLTLIYLAVIASGVCFWLWNKGAALVNGTLLSVMNNFKIPVGIVASCFLLQEEVQWGRLIAGGVMIAVSIWLTLKTKEQICD